MIADISFLKNIQIEQFGEFRIDKLGMLADKSIYVIEIYADLVCA